MRRGYLHRGVCAVRVFLPCRQRHTGLDLSWIVGIGNQYFSGKFDGTVGWDRTSDLRIHNPAL